MTLEEKKLQDIVESEGFQDKNDLMGRCVFDYSSPAICMNEGCDAVYDYEPDQDNGWCEECQTNSVKSALILMGVI